MPTTKRERLSNVFKTQHRPVRLKLLAAAGILLLASCSPEPISTPIADTEPELSADLIIENGRLYSMAWPEPSAEGVPAASAPFSNGVWSPDAQAIAIKDGIILAIGSTSEMSEFRGSATEVVDVHGASIMPGFVDTHTHIEELGATLDDVDLKGVQTEQEAVERVVRHIAANDVPAGQWIVARGWDEGQWADRFPSHDLLSASVPNNPVLMDGMNGFGAWGNQLAMAAAGITADAQDPVGGEIIRDANGAPTGAVRNRGVALYREAVPPLSMERLENRLVNGLRIMQDSGFTAVHHAGVNTELMAAYESLASKDMLPIRVNAMISGRDKALMSQWISRGPTRFAGDKLFVQSVKGYYDGSLGARGAKLLEEYSDRPGHFGVSGEEYGFFTEEIGAMLLAGFQVNIHAIGDGGNREVLQFFRDNFAIDPEMKALRNRIEHAQVVHPDDFAVYDELDVIASVQPPFVAEDKVWTVDRIGLDRAAGAYAWRTFRRHNVPLVFGSDLMGYDWSIFYGLHSAITRQSTDSQPPGGWFPEEKLTAEETIRGYTVNASYANFTENETGMLKEGMWADITVLDQDVFATVAQDPAHLLDGKVLMTIVGGDVVYRQ